MAAGTTIFPILQAVLSRRTERESQGALQGSMSSITAVASIVSPLVMTQLFKAFVGSDPIFGSVSWPGADRKSVASGKSVSVRVDLGGRRIIKNKKNNN